MAATNPMVNSRIVSSPTTSSSSFDLLSPRSRSSTFSSRLTVDEDSEDEIVWGISSDSSSLSTDNSVPLHSEDDFVILGRPPTSNVHARGSSPSAPQSTDLLSSRLSGLSLRTLSPIHQQIHEEARPTAIASISRRRRKVLERKQKASTTKDGDSSATSSSESLSPVRPGSAATLTRKSKRGRRPRKANKDGDTLTGFGERPIVDDISIDGASVSGDEPVGSSMYEEAVKYITSFLSSPPSQPVGSNLVLLQALIVELGLATTSLPASLSSAKAVLKSHAFLNIRDYLAVREQGAAAIQRVMYPSRSALIKDIRRKRNTASLRWVKQTGLQVFLVSCYH